MSSQIITTDQQDHAPTQPLLQPLKKSRGRRAMISCIQESLRFIEKANRTYNADDRHIAIIEYNDNLRRALRAGIKRTDINDQCRQAHYQCLVANLQGQLTATVTGDYYKRIATFIEWFDDDRQRMIEAGYRGNVIDSRMTKIKLKLVKK